MAHLTFVIDPDVLKRARSKVVQESTSVNCVVLAFSPRYARCGEVDVRAVTEAELRESFVNATATELAQLPLPGLHETIWDDREYLGWRDARAARLGYLVCWRGDTLVGVVVRAAPGSLRPGIAAMCALCHSTQPATQVRMFSARLAGPKGDAGSTVGTYICDDLACSHVIRSGPPHLVTAERVASRAAGLSIRVTGFAARIAREASDA